MEFDESEISEICDFIKSLNSKKDSIVAVEGRKDEEALKRLGFSGTVCQFHAFKGLAKFADFVSGYRHLILLLDSDRKGAYLTKRILSQLEHRMTVDLSFRRKLTAITKGKIRHIEDLSLYKLS
ncbi:MAG TPA: toprim domain-containing protein [Candidatus Nitrosotalea sp.]|nr:toprim domain-containing protein [Candidatus Nitrosotalea sp.]